MRLISSAVFSHEGLALGKTNIWCVEKKYGQDFLILNGGAAFTALLYIKDSSGSFTLLLVSVSMPQKHSIFCLNTVFGYTTGTQLLIVINDATWNVNACYHEVSYASAKSLREHFEPSASGLNNFLQPLQVIIQYKNYG